MIEKFKRILITGGHGFLVLLFTKNLSEKVNNKNINMFNR